MSAVALAFSFRTRLIFLMLMRQKQRPVDFTKDQGGQSDWPKLLLALTAQQRSHELWESIAALRSM